MIICRIPERRKDLTTRAEIDRLLAEVKTAETGLLFYRQLRPEDTRATALLAKCEAERTYYTQHACTLAGDTNESED